MNDNLRSEMSIVMGNENVCDDCQVRVNALLSKFLNNISYMNEVKISLDVLINGRDIDFLSEFPKLIFTIIELNKRIVCTYKNIDKEYMKFVIYGVFYNYLDVSQNKLLNSVDQGNLRVSFINSLTLLFTKPKYLNIRKQSLISMLLNCICGNDNIIKI